MDLLVELQRPSYVLLEQVRQTAEKILGVPVDVSTPALLRDEIRRDVFDDAVRCASAVALRPAARRPGRGATRLPGSVAVTGIAELEQLGC